MVALVQELRRKAAFCRRAASISTSGSGRTDRILLALAERLERGAALRERQLQDGTVPRTKSGQRENLGGSRRGGFAAADPARHGGAGARHQDRSANDRGHNAWAAERRVREWRTGMTISDRAEAGEGSAGRASGAGCLCVGVVILAKTVTSEMDGGLPGGGTDGLHDSPLAQGRRIRTSSSRPR